MSRTREWIGLAVWLLVTFAASALGAIFRPGAWYAALSKPAWTPPDSLFAPVWTALYLMMAIAAWLVWRKAGGFRTASPALSAYLVQLALNAAWSWLFFGLHLPGVAFAEIILLWLAIVATMTLFWRRTTIAGVLILPYLLWVSYASALNFALWRMN